MKSTYPLPLLGFALLSAGFAIQAQTGEANILSLDEAVRRAGTGSVQVRAASSLSESAARGVGVAASSFFPKISASVSGAWLANPPEGMTVKAGALGTLPLIVPTGSPLPDTVYPGPFIYHPVTLPATDWAIVPDAKPTYFKGNLTLTQPLLAWGKINAGLQLVRLEAEIAAIGLSTSRLDAEREAKRSYNAALFARDAAALLVELRDLEASIALDSDQAFAAGTTTKDSVLKARADLSDIDARLVEAKEGEKSALIALAILVGMGDATEIQLSSALVDTLPAIDEARLLETAKASSGERGKALAKASQAGRKLDLERGSSIFLPNVAAFASLDASGQNIPFSSSSWMDTTWSWDFSLGISAQLDLFDGGASIARLSQARADLAAARIGVEGAEDSLAIEVRQALAAARKAEAAVRSKAARAAWAAEVLRSAKTSLDAGVLGRGGFNGAAMLEAGARFDLLSARYALSEARADLERLGGGVLP